MDKSNYRNMWVHVEHDGEKIHPVTLELCSEIRKLCDQSGGGAVDKACRARNILSGDRRVPGAAA